MSKKIYLMRHSIPEKINIETSMIPLSDEGIVLAKSKKEVMKSVDHCFSSSYKRAIDTAKLITEIVGLEKSCYGKELRMLDNLIIRPETPADYKETELMTMRSFWNKYWPGCTEHFLIRIIRESKDYIPEISRIAEIDGKIVGAVYYTKAWIDDGEVKHEIATFGPLAVEPTMEGNDIGGALMRETIKLAKEAGIKAIALMGEPNYYPRFGFKRGAECGITDAQGNTFDALMCLPLSEDFSQVKGKLIESSDFEKLEDEKRLEEINKEFPVYRKVKVQEGFMQIFEQHLGVVESIEEDEYMVRYWELLIPAKLSEDFGKEPSIGSDVKFIWNHKGESKITQVFKNLLEDYI